MVNAVTYIIVHGADDSLRQRGEEHPSYFQVTFNWNPNYEARNLSLSTDAIFIEK